MEQDLETLNDLLLKRRTYYPTIFKNKEFDRLMEVVMKQIIDTDDLREENIDLNKAYEETARELEEKHDEFSAMEDYYEAAVKDNKKLSEELKEVNLQLKQYKDTYGDLPVQRQELPSSGSNINWEG